MILTAAETTGVSILGQIQRCAWRARRENRPFPKIAVSPRAWEALLSFFEMRPMRLQEAKDGRTARIVLFVGGERVEVAADKSIEDFNHLEWIDE